MKTKTTTQKVVLLLCVILTSSFIANAQTGKYRFEQPYLFQSVPYKLIPAKVSGGDAFNLEPLFGPTYKLVDILTAWPWKNLGGDWLDSNLVSQGSAPWFSIPVDSVVPTYQPVSYQGDITKIVAHVYNTDRWNAYLLKSKNAARTIASPFDTVNNPPKIVVTYTNNTTDTLRCRIVAANSASSTLPITTSEKFGLPVFIEFDKPTSPVKSAIFYFDIVAHWSGGANPRVEGYLLDPVLNTNSVEYGVAKNTGLLDLNIENESGVLGAQRYVDGTSFTDFAVPGGYNINAEWKYDPAIYGTGPQDLNLLPHYGLGKWINPAPGWSLVSSTYTGEGFKPLAPGLGALKITMPNHNPSNGDAIGYIGESAGDANLFMPDSLNGQPFYSVLDHIFVRYYFFIGTPFHRTPDDRKQFYRSTVGSSSTPWTDMGGKWGMVPDGTTTYGGFSGSSGGGRGWQMRNSWSECDAGLNGPSEGGWAVGYHMYDFQQNPPGYNYGFEDETKAKWGQGGMNLLYAGNWYCIETELQLNTVNNVDSGYLADGYQKTWIDGKLVYERTGMVFRTPLDSFPNNNPLLSLRPIRSVGIKNLKLNWFHGGLTPSTVDRTTFYTGLVWGTEYIGPMNMNPTGITLNSNTANDISIYPNPSNDLFNISITNSKNEDMSISVYDLTSKLIYKKQLRLTEYKTNISIDLSNYSKGVYLLQAVTPSGTVNKKIVKQ